MLESLGIESTAEATPDHPLLELLPAGIDELVRATRTDPAQVAATLLELELAGLVAEGEGVYRALTLEATYSASPCQFSSDGSFSPALKRA